MIFLVVRSIHAKILKRYRLEWRSAWKSRNLSQRILSWFLIIFIYLTIPQKSIFYHFYPLRMNYFRHSHKEFKNPIFSMLRTEGSYWEYSTSNMSFLYSSFCEVAAKVILYVILWIFNDLRISLKCLSLLSIFSLHSRFHRGYSHSCKYLLLSCIVGSNQFMVLCTELFRNYCKLFVALCIRFWLHRSRWGRNHRPFSP